MRKLHLVPLIVGSYGVFLGLGLVTIGLAEIKEGIGIVRLLIGLGMAGFGFYGVWDGVRDLIKPQKKAGMYPARQFILTDTSGNRSSLVTPELLRGQIEILIQSQDYKNFTLQILPPLPAGESGGMLKQIGCIYHDHVILMAFFEMSGDGYRMYQKNTELDGAVEWLKQLLAGNPDFSEWESVAVQMEKEMREGERKHGKVF